jgi:hypothetical protein
MESLPPEVLRDILYPLNAHEICRLWLTGARIFRMKLNQSVSVLRYGKGVGKETKLVSWPSNFISLFPYLGKIAMHFNSQSIHPRPLTLTSEQVLSLPQTMHTIHMRVSNVLTDDTIKLLPRTLTVLKLDNEEHLTAPALLDLPPNLISFGIWMPSLTDEAASYFPRSITRLCLWSSAKFHASDMALLLPPNLVKLRVGIITTSVWDFYYMHHKENGTLTLEIEQANETGSYKKGW